MFELSASLAKGYEADPYAAHEREGPLELAPGPRDHGGIVGRNTDPGNLCSRRSAAWLRQGTA